MGLRGVDVKERANVFSVLIQLLICVVLPPLAFSTSSSSHLCSNFKRKIVFSRFQNFSRSLSPLFSPVVVTKRTLISFSSSRSKNMKGTHKNQSKKNASYSRNRSKRERIRHPTSSAMEKQNNIGCGQRTVAALMAISQETEKVSCLANFKNLEKLDLKFNSLTALEILNTVTTNEELILDLHMVL